MEARHHLRAFAPPQVGIHHLADNGAGANDGHLHYDVVEGFRLHARQARHLCSASVAAAAPFAERSFIVEIKRQRFWYPARFSTSNTYRPPAAAVISAP